MEHTKKKTITIQIDEKYFKLYQLLKSLRAVSVIAILGMLLWKCIKQSNTLQFIAERENIDAFAFSVSNNISTWEILLILLTVLVIITTVVKWFINKKHIIVQK